MNLGDLTTQFKGLLNNGVVNNNATLVSTFINQAIMRIQRELRVPFMEKQILYTIPTGFTKLAIPSDLLELISIQVDSDSDGIIDLALDRVNVSRVAAASQTGGIPCVYSRQGGNWLLGPMPTAGSQVLITYYAEFAPLVATSDTNACSQVAWDLIVNGALSYATDYIGDTRFEKFEGRYTQIAKSLQDQADADELTAEAVASPALDYSADGCW